MWRKLWQRSQSRPLMETWTEDQTRHQIQWRKSAEDSQVLSLSNSSPNNAMEFCLRKSCQWRGRMWPWVWAEPYTEAPLCLHLTSRFDVKKIWGEQPSQQGWLIFEASLGGKIADSVSKLQEPNSWGRTARCHHATLIDVFLFCRISSISLSLGFRGACQGWEV